MRLTAIIICLLFSFMTFNCASGGSTQETSSGTSQESSEESSQDSTDESLQDSTDNSSETSTENSSKDGNAAIIIAVVVSAGLLVWLSIMGTNNQGTKAQLRLSRYLKKNSSLIRRDILLAHGRTLNDWAFQLGLSRGELAKFRMKLEGSREQDEMLSVLGKEITIKKVKKFSASITRLLVKALGRKRFEVITRASLRRLGINEAAAVIR